MSFLTTFFLWGVIFRKALLVLLLKKWAKSRREERARAAPALRGEQWIISNDIIYPFSFSTPTITATLEEWKQSKFKYFKKNTFRWEKILVERNWVEWWKNNAMSRNVTNWVRSWVPINNTIISLPLELIFRQLPVYRVFGQRMAISLGAIELWPFARFRNKVPECANASNKSR